MLFGCQDKPFYKESKFLMGTVAEVICQNKEAIDLAFKEIERLDKLFNRFDSHSEISRLNKEGIYKVSRETLEIVKRSVEFSKISDGAFDITIGPIADLWKEKIKSKIADLPKEEQIKERLKFVGYDKIIIDEKNSVIRFSQKGVSLDLGGIAKGYAVDFVAKKIRSMGIKDFLIKIGGCIYASGKKRERNWRIGIQHPRKKEEFYDFVELKDKAIDTSGDYEQFFIFEGKRYSHIISPFTGYPVDNGIISVTVISKEATVSDFLSTAIFVLGKERGKELAEKFKDTEVKILTEEDI